MHDACFTVVHDHVYCFAWRAPQSRTQSIDYSLLKELAGSIHGLKVVLRDEQRLVGLFWLSELPPRDKHGNFSSDSRLLKEVQPFTGEI